MRVVLISKYGPPIYSGAGRKMFRLAQALQSLGHDSQLVTARLSDELPKYEVLEGVPIRRLPLVKESISVSDATFHAACAVWLLQNHAHYDLVQFGYLPRFWLSVLVVARATRKPVFLRTTMFGSDDLETLAHGGLVGKLQLRMSRQASGILAISRRIEEVSQPYLRDASLMHYIPNFVDPAVYYPLARGSDKVTLRSRLGLPCDRPILLFCGNVSYRKGFDLLIEALPGVLRHHPKTVLCVLGPRVQNRKIGARATAFQAEVDQRVGELGVARSVIFCGQQDSRVAHYLRAANVLVLPSRREGMPNAVLEAMATGLPVVICSYPWLPRDFIKHEETGLIAAPTSGSLGDSLVRVLGDRALAMALGRFAREEVMRLYQTDAVVPRIAGLYEAHA